MKLFEGNHENEGESRIASTNGFTENSVTDDFITVALINQLISIDGIFESFRREIEGRSVTHETDGSVLGLVITKNGQIATSRNFSQSKRGRIDQIVFGECNEVALELTHSAGGESLERGVGHGCLSFLWKVLL